MLNHYLLKDLIKLICLMKLTFCLINPITLQDNSESYLIQTTNHFKLSNQISGIFGKTSNPKKVILKKLSPFSEDYYVIENVSKELLNQLPSIETYEKIHPVSLRRDSNDPLFQSQWNLDLINVRQAWNYTTGGATHDGKKIVMAIIDDGFDINHPDLKGNLWVNKNEIPDNGIDDDKNGYIDDIHGINLASNTGEITVRSHGTGAAGIAAAKGNNTEGITGINWDVEMMYFSNANSTSSIVEALQYIMEQRKLYDETSGEKGAYVVATSMSLGLERGFEDEFPIWCNSYNELGKLGILNAVAAPNADVNIDEIGDMPSLCSSPYIISVTNVTSNDALAMQAGHGVENVDIGAPGGEDALDNGLDTPTTAINAEYTEFGGTSAATPHVGGTIALLHSAPCTGFANRVQGDPATTALEIKDIILQQTDQNATLQGKTSSGGRLNVHSALLKISEFCDNGGGLSSELEIITHNPQLVGSAIEFSYKGVTSDMLEYSLSDLSGRVLASADLPAPIFETNTVTIPLSSEIPAGVYFITLRQGDLKETFKISLL